MAKARTLTKSNPPGRYLRNPKKVQPLRPLRHRLLSILPRSWRVGPSTPSLVCLTWFFSQLLTWALKPRARARTLKTASVCPPSKTTSSRCTTRNKLVRRTKPSTRNSFGALNVDFSSTPPVWKGPRDPSGSIQVSETSTPEAFTWIGNWTASTQSLRMSSPLYVTAAFPTLHQQVESWSLLTRFYCLLFQGENPVLPGKK